MGIGGGMDMDGMYGIAAAGGGVIAVLAQMAWSRFFGEGKQRTELVDQLSQRIQVQEDRMLRVENELDEERRLRRLAEDKVQVLEWYVVMLKASLSRHGITVPPHPMDNVKHLPSVDEE